MKTDYRKSLDALERACKEVLDAETLKAVVAAKRRIQGEPERETVSRRSIKIPIEIVPTCSMAELRKALGKLRAELWNNAIISGKRKFELYEIADAAIAAPARNCDRFGGDFKMLHTAWFDWTGSPSGQNPDGTVKLTFAEWLLEIAEVHHA